MRYFRAAAFEQAYRALDVDRQSHVDKAIRQMGRLFETHERPFGIGLKSLKPGLWEIRAGLSERIVFRWSGDLVELLLVGSHDEIQRYLKRH